MNIKKAVLVLFRLCISGDYRRLRSLKVFDSGYYLSCKGQGAGDDLDPLWTYLKTGRSEANTSLKKSEGWSQQADPHPLFDSAFYLLQYFPDGITQNPLLHYLHSGWKNGYRPGPFFDSVTYGERSGWTKEDGDPLTHYSHHGKLLEVSPCLSFDYEFYFDRNPILAAVGSEIIKHYKLHGASIGKSPLPIFDSQFYLQNSGDGASAASDPLSHYLSRADDSSRLPGMLFDPVFYVQQCNNSIELVDALIHYVTCGVFKGIYPHKRVADLADTPVISLLVPVYNPDPAVLRNCMRSVLYQAYPHWELCLVDDCSSNDDVRPLLEEWAQKDSRIKVKFQSQNGGISKATNSAATLATGSYLGFLDNDDELTVDCLLEVVEVINGQGADLVYSDEDLIGDDGTTLSVFRKPSCNDSLLLSHNYITHFVAVKRSVFDLVGGLDSTCDGAQDFDLMLKFFEVCKNIVHIPKVLYHWRASESSTSINHGQKSYANEAGRLALGAALERRKLPCKAENTDLNFFYKLNCSPKKAKYTLLIWAVNEPPLSLGFVTSVIRGCSDIVVDVVVIVPNDVGDTPCLPEVEGTEDWTVVAVTREETKAQTFKRLIAETTAEFVVLLGGGIEQLDNNWLIELGGMVSLPDVAIVCGRTRYAGGDGRSYLLPDTANDSAAYFNEFLCSSSKHMTGLHCIQDIGYAEWDMCLIAKNAFEAVGGFSVKEFPRLFSMAELSLRVVDAGKRIVYTPYAVAGKVKQPGSLCSGESMEIQEEKRRFQKCLKGRSDGGIPFYNTGLLGDNKIDEADFVRWLHGDSQ